MSSIIVEDELGRVSKCCEVRVDDVRGRCLVAREAIAPGDVVLEEFPWAAAIFPDRVQSLCDHTLKASSQRLLRCSKTKVARYCSREAQAAAWKAYYRDESRALEALRGGDPEFLCRRPVLRLLARTFWRRRTGSPARWRIASELLCNNWPLFTDARKIELAKIAADCHQILKLEASSPTGEDPSVEIITAMLARISCNALTITDDDLKPIGIGLYPLAALANHDCNPNCCQVFSGSKLEYRCVRSVAKGEEVTISYVDPCSLRSERRAILLDDYCFDLDATGTGRDDQSESSARDSDSVQVVRDHPRVEARSGGFWRDDETPLVAVEVDGRPGGAFLLQRGDKSRSLGQIPHAEDHFARQDGASSAAPSSGSHSSDEDTTVVCSFFDPSLATAAGDVLLCAHNRLTEAEALYKAQDYRAGLAKIEGLATDLRAPRTDSAGLGGFAVVLGSCHICVIRILVLERDLRLSMGDYGGALAITRDITVPLRRLYPSPEKWPHFGHHLAMAAKLQAYQGHLEEAVRAAREALSILENTLPRGNATISEVERVMNDCLREMKLAEAEAENGGTGYHVSMG